MPIRVALRHVTTYAYEREVFLAPQVLRLRPAPHCRTPIHSYSLLIEPAAHTLHWQQDPQGNFVARITFPERVRLFRIEVDLVAELVPVNPFDFFLEPEAYEFPFHYPDWQLRDLQPYLDREPASSRFAAFVQSVRPRDQPTVAFLVELGAKLRKEIAYEKRLEPGVQDTEKTVELASGSCRDSSWLLVQTLRHLGLAARFVSGYLIQLATDSAAPDAPAAAASDFTDLHAWCEVYLPGAGWIGIDPTSGMLATEGHIPLACTPHPISAAPISGAVELCEVVFSHEMSVVRIEDSDALPRPDDPRR